MNEKTATDNRAVLGAGGVAAIALVVLGIFTKTAYKSVAAAAVVWSAASLSMVVLGVTFIAVRRRFETPVALLVGPLLFLKAVLVVFPLFIIYKQAAGFMDVLTHFENVVDVLFLGVTAWAVFCGRRVLGKALSIPTAALLSLATLGLLTSHPLRHLNGSVPAFLAWTIILSTLLGFFGLGIGFIRLAFRNPRG
jgi:hypothetical protein